MSPISGNIIVLLTAVRAIVVIEYTHESTAQFTCADLEDVRTPSPAFVPCSFGPLAMCAWSALVESAEHWGRNSHWINSQGWARPKCQDSLGHLSSRVFQYVPICYRNLTIFDIYIYIYVPWMVDVSFNNWLVVWNVFYFPIYWQQ